MTSEPDPLDLVVFDLDPDTGERPAGLGQKKPPPDYLDLTDLWWDAPDDFPTEFNLYRSYSSVPARCRGGVIAIGKFDGLHLGHLALIEAAARKAEELDAPFGVLTFEPHPRAVFEPQSEPFLISSPSARARSLAELGLDVLLSQNFDREFAGLSAEDFVGSVLIDGLAVRHVVVGYDFRFGRERTGDVALLRELCRCSGIGCTVVEALNVAGEAAGSTRVRSLLAQGRPRAAARVLGRCWELEGELQVAAGGEENSIAAVPFGDHQVPAAGFYSGRLAPLDKGAAGWRPVLIQVGRRPDLAILSGFDEATTRSLGGRRVRLAFVDYHGPHKRKGFTEPD